MSAIQSPPREKTLYLHVGLPKTGSTSIQTFCSNNREILFSRFGLYYPKTGTTRRPRHHALFPPRESMWKELENEVSSFMPCNILLSEESLALEFKKIQEGNWLSMATSHFPGYKIKIVLYIRRFDDRFKSYYAQKLKRYHTQKFKRYYLPGPSGGFNIASYADFLKDCMERHPQEIFLSEYIDFFSSLVGSENIIARIYDKTLLKNGNIICDFFDIFGIDISDIPHDYKNNPSIPYETIPLLTEKLIPSSVDEGVRKDLYAKVLSAYAPTTPVSLPIDRIKEEIDRLDTSVPGYKKLFEKRECSFDFSEKNLDPSSLLCLDLLYSGYLRDHNADEEIKKLQGKVDELSKTIKKNNKRITTCLDRIDKFVAAEQKKYSFPTKPQRAIMACYYVLLYPFASKKYRNKFWRRPVAFFTKTQHPANQFIFKILLLFGPKPAS